MPRTAVTVEAISRTGAAAGAGTAADPTNDHEVDLATTPLEEYVFEFRNTDASARIATIVASVDNPPALSAGQGNLDISVPATTGVMRVGGLDSARFLRKDGKVSIDLAASFAGTVHAYRIPR